MSDDDSSDPEAGPGEPKTADANPEAPKVKRARRVAPAFQPSMLSDPQKGLQALLHRFEKFDDSALDGSRESLALMMRTYQGWLYNLFPADFGDMCWKIGDRKNVKLIVRDFVWDKKGFNRTIRRDTDPDGSDNEAPPPPAPPANFLDDAEDATPEILDLFDYGNPE
jgi:hypothetical protein